MYFLKVTLRAISKKAPEYIKIRLNPDTMEANISFGQERERRILYHIVSAVQMTDDLIGACDSIRLKRFKIGEEIKRKGIV